MGGMTRRALLRAAGGSTGTLAFGGVVGRVVETVSGRLSGTDTGLDDVADEVLQLALVTLTPGRQHLIADLDETHHVTDDGRVEVLLWPGDLAKLVATGLPFEITVPDLVLRDVLADRDAPQVSAVARQPGETTTGDYRSLADYEADLRSLAERFPEQTRLIELPYRTLEGRTVLALEIADDVHASDGRPTFYNDGLTHAREWPAGEVVIMWAFDLLENQDDPANRRFLQRSRNLVVPVVNPDGFHHSREFPIDDNIPGLGSGASGLLLGGQGQYWRKNKRSFLGTDVGVGIGPAIPKPVNIDAYGVDVNRNYAYEWGDDTGGSSSDVLSAVYRGASPFSEPEAMNVRWLLTGRQVLGANSHHTSGDLVLWPWGDTRDDAPDNAVLEGLGRAMAIYNGYRPQKAVDLYITTGTTLDWAYGALGTIAYTFEHAGSSFHPAYASTVPAMYEKNRDTFRLLNEITCLAPEERDLSVYRADALARLADFADPAGLHHAIVTGRVVGAGSAEAPAPAPGNGKGKGRNKNGKARPDDGGGSGGPEGVQAVLELAKRFETRLWKRGDGSNPLGQVSIPEQLTATMTTAPDGQFVWHVNPSTQPAIEFDGGEEPYTLAARAGGLGASREFVVRRGQVLDLGDLTLG